MLSKVLITLLILVVAVIYLRRQREKQRAARPPARARNSAADPWQQQHRAAPDLPVQPPVGAATLKIVLWGVMLGAVLIGSIVSWLHWQDQQRLVTVLLYRDADQAPAIYRVSKRNLGDGSFITENGTRVTVSANERIEIVGL